MTDSEQKRIEPQPIQSALILDYDTASESEKSPKLNEGQVILTDEEQHPVSFDNRLNEDQSVTPDRKETKSMRKWFWAGLAIFGLAIAELVVFSLDVFARRDILSGLWLLVLVMVSAWLARTLWREYSALRQLKKQAQHQETARQMLDVPAIGNATHFCQTLASRLDEKHQDAVSAWEAELQPHFMDSEVLQLFDQKVLSQADEVALGYVSRHASASAALIAVSPFALLDMAIVLWRNFAMLKQVSQAYGIQLTYWGRISLVRSVFKTMLYAGASEIVADAGNYAMSAGVTGKLSTRLAQGLGAGVLTTRIGLKTMQTCRPIPWIAQKPPGVSRFARQILSDLKKLTS